MVVDRMNGDVIYADFTNDRMHLFVVI